MVSLARVAVRNSIGCCLHFLFASSLPQNLSGISRTCRVARFCSQALPSRCCGPILPLLAGKCAGDDDTWLPAGRTRECCQGSATVPSLRHGLAVTSSQLLPAATRTGTSAESHRRTTAPRMCTSPAADMRTRSETCFTISRRML